MKMVIAYIQPFVVDKVVKALQDIPEVPGASFTEVRGFGRGRGQKDQESLATEIAQAGTLRKTRLETMIPDHLEEKVIKTIRDAARTGMCGDGKIYVASIQRAVRIRTGQEGPDAL